MIDAEKGGTFECNTYGQQRPAACGGTVDSAEKANFFLDQHGCAKNQVDGEVMISRLEAAGFTCVDDPAKAECIVINTCGFIESAKKESLDALFQTRKSYPKAKIIFTGCLAARYQADFKAALPEADAILGFNDDLVTVAKKALGTVTEPVLGSASVHRTKLLSLPGSVYVKIAEGCDNRCSFCAIPLIRGPLKSRPVNDVVAEVRGLLARGIFEVNLIAQDLAAYGTDTKAASALPALLSALSALPGDFWLRLLYIHPDHFPLEILECMKTDPRILPYFDIPFQSGSDPILHAMNRRRTAEENLALLATIRRTFRTPVFRSTWLCGFPGESDADAEATAAFLEAGRPLWSGCFTYSREDDTPASLLKNRVPAKLAGERKMRMEALQERITAEHLASFVGTTQTVLIEEILEKPPQTADSDTEALNYALGRAWFQAPEVDGAVILPYDGERQKPLPGQTVPVRITGVSGVDLLGSLV